jgi:hypothetical protein
MSNNRLSCILSVVTAGFLLGACSGSPDSLVIMGAASTRLINEDMQSAVAPDMILEFNNAGSGTLVSQLEEGAPADVFIAADKEAMEKAVAAGVVSNPMEVATNSMVLIVPADNPGKISSFADLGSSKFNDATVVICDTQVPCGRVTKELEDANNISITADSLEQSVADVAGKVASGEADAGVVYTTDATALDEVVSVIEIPHSQEYRNTLMAAVVNHSQNPDDAAKVVDLLTSPVFASAWEDRGFQPVTK